MGNDRQQKKGIAQIINDLSHPSDRIAASAPQTSGSSQTKKMDLFIRRQGIDTTTSGGKARFGMLGIFAEFERSMNRERGKAGIKRVRADNPNKLWGRRPIEIAKPELVKRIKGISMRAIADEVKVSSWTVWKIVRGTVASPGPYLTTIG